MNYIQLKNKADLRLFEMFGAGLILLILCIFSSENIKKYIAIIGFFMFLMAIIEMQKEIEVRKTI